MKVLMIGEAIRQMQMKNLLARGYAFNEKDIPLPDKKMLKLGPALLVDYAMPINKQCELLGVKNYIHPRDCISYHPSSQGRWGWIYEIESGEKMLGKTPYNATAEFGPKKRRGLMVFEGLALYRENPNLLRDYGVNLSGSRCGEFGHYVPSLCLQEGEASLFRYWADLIHLDFGSASCVPG